MSTNRNQGSSLLQGPKNNMSIKSQEYESKIYQLSNQIKVLREKLFQLENEKGTQREQQLSSLKVQNARLMRENKCLRIRIQELEKELKKRQGNQVASDRVYEVKNIKSSTQDKRRSGTTTQLLRELLAECNEPSECGNSMRLDKNKDQFYEFKSTQDCFEPWFGQLSKELKLRLKRCLTRQKQLLYVSSQVQIGCLCPYSYSHSDPNDSFRCLLVLTNLSPLPISNLIFSPLYSKDVSVERKGKENTRQWSHFGEVRPNQQVKEDISITVNSIDFRCVQLELQFEIGDMKVKQLLILPFSKAKLFRNVPYTASPAHCQRVERVFEFERKVLGGVQKFDKLWNVVQGKSKVSGSRYFWKIQFLGRCFWVEAGKVEQKMMIGVNFEQERSLAEKVLEEYVFLLQKL